MIVQDIGFTVLWSDHAGAFVYEVLCNQWFAIEIMR